jgi:hypothetical protein
VKWVRRLGKNQLLARPPCLRQRTTPRMRLPERREGASRAWQSPSRQCALRMVGVFWRLHVSDSSRPSSKIVGNVSLHLSHPCCGCGCIGRGLCRRRFEIQFVFRIARIFQHHIPADVYDSDSPCGGCWLGDLAMRSAIQDIWELLLDVRLRSPRDSRSLPRVRDGDARDFRSRLTQNRRLKVRLNPQP